MSEDRPQYGRRPKNMKIKELTRLIQEQAVSTDVLCYELCVATPRTLERLHEFFTACMLCKRQMEKYKDPK